jgi:hypothetical protein
MIKVDGGTFNNQLGADALMECRRGGHGDEDEIDD